MTEADRAHARLAELVAALSLGVDLGFGQPMEHALRQCLIALRLAELAGLDAEDRAVVYYAALLVAVGCHSDAHEQAKWFGDDVALKATKYGRYEMTDVRGALEMLRLLGSGHTPLHRFRVGVEFALGGRRDLDDMIATHARVAQSLAEQLPLRPDVREALGRAYERWDGRGWPDGLAGEAIPVAARIAQLADFAEVAQRTGGVEAAHELARTRAGTQFDPGLCDLVRTHASAIFADLDTIDTWDAVIAGEPALATVLSGERLDAALLAIADFIDLKSPYTLGHASAVAELAGAAAAELGMASDEQLDVRRAAVVHDYGRLGVSNAIWDRPGRLGAGAWERIRMFPYITERMLRQSPALKPLARIAVAHRERLDGSGYPRGLAGEAIEPAARLLAAADAYQSMCEPRPYREGLAPAAAAAQLEADVRAGRLDPEAVRAVLRAAGHRVARRPAGAAGLTAREIEVLRLLALGLSNKEIARRLVISPKTAGTHVEHIYAKTGAINRATASLFAVRHGLLAGTEIGRTPDAAAPARA